MADITNYIFNQKKEIYLMPKGHVEEPRNDTGYLNEQARKRVGYFDQLKQRQQTTAPSPVDKEVKDDTNVNEGSESDSK